MIKLAIKTELYDDNANYYILLGKLSIQSNVMFKHNIA